MTKVLKGWTLDPKGRQVRPAFKDRSDPPPLHRYVITINDFSVQIIAPSHETAVEMRKKQLEKANGPGFPIESGPIFEHAETCSCGGS